MARSALRSTGSTDRWRKIRAKVLFRDQDTCYYCGQYASTVDHLIPRSKGGLDTMDNLVAACTRLFVYNRLILEYQRSTLLMHQ